MYNRTLSFILVIGVIISISTITAPLVSAAPVVYKSHAIDRQSGNFTGLKITYTLPSSGHQFRNANSGCINHPMWMTYPSGAWVEIGLQQCFNEANNTFHTYQFALAGGQGQWGPAAYQYTVGSTVTLELRKINTSTWGFYINGNQVWTKSHSDYTQSTGNVEYGLEVDSPAFGATTAYYNSIQYQTTLNGQYNNKNWWNPIMNSAAPERYYINGQANYPSSWAYGYGLPARLNWSGVSFFGLGAKNLNVTNVWDSREAEDYSGLQHIEAIANYTTSDGQNKRYVAGWHQDDAVELIMQVTTNPFWLHVIGISDKPGPVTMNIYVDGTYRGQMSLTHNDNARHLTIATFNIAGIATNKPHTIAVEFANDYSTGSGDNDRNFFIDLIGITPPQ